MGQPFPFWVRQQTPLYLKVATAEPAPLVRLTRGLELSVVPRPRKRAQQSVADTGEAGSTAESAPQEAWLRLQACRFFALADS